MTGGFSIWPLIPVLLMFVPFAIGNYFVAGRMGRSGILWAILSLIPFVNFIFVYYVVYAVIVYVLGRLNEISAQRAPATQAT